MSNVERFTFSEVEPLVGMASLLPYLPLTLINGNTHIGVSCLLDTGSTVNVMPYNIGLQLGAVWDKQTIPISLSGSWLIWKREHCLFRRVSAVLTQSSSIFAWTQSNDAPLLLGQVNFFMEFDVYFSRSRSFFEVQPKK